MSLKSRFRAGDIIYWTKYPGGACYIVTEIEPDYHNCCKDYDNKITVEGIENLKPHETSLRYYDVAFNINDDYPDKEKLQAMLLGNDKAIRELAIDIIKANKQINGLK